jgi:hypothetical protein
MPTVPHMGPSIFPAAQSSGESSLKTTATDVRSACKPFPAVSVRGYLRLRAPRGAGPLWNALRS